VHKPRQVRLARTITYHNEKEPYDPDADTTPRRKYVFGGAVVIAIAAAVLTSASKSIRSDSDKPEYKSASTLVFGWIEVFIIITFRGPGDRRRISDHIGASGYT
jgi:hypothetical protein